MSKYLELFKGAFDSTVADKMKPENKPYIGYSLTEGKMAYTVVPPKVEGPVDNEIWYTTSDRNIISSSGSFDASIVSNEYKDGQGVITFDSPVTSIGDGAFFECYTLTSITFPKSVTSIISSAFYECSSLTSIVVKNDNTTYDSRENCNAIIETATNTLIAGCPNTTIPNSVTSIGNAAFYFRSGLTSVTIPNSVTNIGGNAFYNCINIISITFEGTMEEWNIITKGSDWNYKAPATYVQCSDG